MKFPSLNYLQNPSKKMSSRNIDTSLKMGSPPSKGFVLFSSMKTFKNDDFTSKSFFVPKIFKYLSLLFGHVEKTA